jgi:hypothetical protein
MHENLNLRFFKTERSDTGQGRDAVSLIMSKITSVLGLFIDAFSTSHAIQ